MFGGQSCPTCTTPTKKWFVSDPPGMAGNAQCGRKSRIEMAVLLYFPPRPPLFPYTTLFRSGRSPRGRRSAGAGPGRRAGPLPPHVRSEEHTSELQSHHDLVCRLLLEKKNVGFLDTQRREEVVLKVTIKDDIHSSQLRESFIG